MVPRTAQRTPAKPSARERLLASANELFYAEGVQSVGIDRIIEHAGVAKASLYNTFGNKEGLVRAYLESRRERNIDRLTRALTRFRTPRERLLGVFDAQGDLFTTAEYHGCAFVAASSEAPSGGSIEQASDEYRGWLRGLFVELAREVGVADPEGLGHQLNLLYDGATVSSRMDRDPTTASIAREAAVILLDAAPMAAAGPQQPHPAGAAQSERPGLDPDTAAATNVANDAITLDSGRV